MGRSRDGRRRQPPSSGRSSRPPRPGRFPAGVRGRIVARFSIGPALAPAVGVPAATWLGQRAGWRTAFAATAGAALLTAVAVVALPPSYPPAVGGAARGTAPDRRRSSTLLLATAVGVGGLRTLPDVRDGVPARRQRLRTGRAGAAAVRLRRRRGGGTAARRPVPRRPSGGRARSRLPCGPGPCVSRLLAPTSRPRAAALPSPRASPPGRRWAAPCCRRTGRADRAVAGGLLTAAALAVLLADRKPPTCEAPRTARRRRGRLGR